MRNVDGLIVFQTEPGRARREIEDGIDRIIALVQLSSSAEEHHAIARDRLRRFATPGSPPGTVVTETGRRPDLPDWYFTAEHNLARLVCTGAAYVHICPFCDEAFKATHGNAEKCRKPACARAAEKLRKQTERHATALAKALCPVARCREWTPRRRARLCLRRSVAKIHGQSVRSDLRRSAIVNMERAGLSRSVAMQLTGAQERGLYRRYAITSEADLREGVDRLNEVAESPSGDTKAQSSGAPSKQTA